MRLRSLILACVLAAFSHPSAAAGLPEPTMPLLRDHALVGRVWLPDQQAFTSPDELLSLARQADVVMLGETHDNQDHHALQAWMVGQLTKSGKKPVVAFEMIDSAQAPALAAHLAAHPADATGLGAALGWEKSGWPDWTDNYRPIAQAALSGGARLAAANLSRDETKTIAKGDIPKAWMGKLGLEKPQAPDQRQAMEADIQAGHCHMLPDRALPAMVRVQRARDAVMAHAVAQGAKSILIAGAGHVRNDLAAPRHLAEMAPGRKVLSIAFLEVQKDKADPSAYAEAFDDDTLPFDAVWFTAHAERPDPCEAFRKHMEQKKG
ncbi:MAG: ChaN family lipoprotein [Magnetospirillum gryphiswaldense]|nr:ChaN family lipoprotein [Magnetospirillum gryphiswaldense]